MKKIIFINILVFIFLFIFLEIISLLYAAGIRLYQTNNGMVLTRYKNSILEYILNTYTKKEVYSYYDILEKRLRPVAGSENKSRPIILFGCSVTYGNLLDNENNFSGILSKISKRPVYNMAYDGWSPAHMLKQLRENRKLLFVNNPEYIIFTLIKDHKRRLVFYQGWGYETQLYLRYKIDKNGEIYPIERKFPFYYRFFIAKNIQHTIENIKIKNQKIVQYLMFKIFEYSVSIIKSRWINSKLIMLIYNDDLCPNSFNNELYDTENTLTKEEQLKFKNMGFEILNIEHLAQKSFCGVEYHAKCPIYGDLDLKHPSTKMWEEFVPKLVEKLNM